MPHQWSHDVKAGVKIETISSILGHEDLRTTIDHLCLNLTDMMGCMQAYAQYQKMVKCPQNGIFMGKPVTCSGLREI